MAMLAILILPLMFLGFTAIACVIPSAVASIANAGPHGFSEILYLYTSSTGNNGSAFGGITGNTFFYNMTGAVAMFVGRFLMIIPAMAICRRACREEETCSVLRHVPDDRRPLRRPRSRRHRNRRRTDVLSPHSHSDPSSNTLR